MPSRVVTLGLLACSFLICACSKSPPPAGKVVALDQVCNEADGSRVRLTGYVRYRRGLLSFCSSFGGHETCDLQLNASAEAPADFNVLAPSNSDRACCPDPHPRCSRGRPLT